MYNILNKKKSYKYKEDSSFLYKASIYNVEIQNENDKYLIFNNFSTALSLVSDEVYKLVASKKSIDIREFVNNGTLKEELEFMVDNSFLVPVDFNEAEYVENFIRSKWDSSDNAVVVIAPTTHCNMQCPYCFETGVVTRNIMSKEVQEQAFQFIKETYPNKNISLVWYGGEPLLATNVIDELSQKVISYTQSINKNYSSGMITNASLLTPEVSDKLHHNKVSILQVTLDGFEESHDKRRSLKTGKVTFWDIVSNLEYAKDLFKISLRINVDRENIGDAIKLLHWLETEKKHWRNIVIPYVAPVTKVHDALNYKNVINRKDFSGIYEEYYIDYFMNREDTNTGILKSSEEYFLDQCCALERKAWRGLYPFSLTNPCGVAGKNLIVIDPEGNLYKCWDTVGDKKHIVGDVFKGLYNNEMMNMWSSYKMPNKCLECDYLPICLGGCVRECACNNNTPSCPQDLMYYKKVLLNYYEKWKSGCLTMEEMVAADKMGQ